MSLCSTVTFTEKTDEVAVIMAAGLGTRMRPLTDEMPKPLVTVNGIPLIETVIGGLRARGVGHIYVVTGYMYERFNYLTEKYSDLTLLFNKDYAGKNNIASVCCACDYMLGHNVFICEADILILDSSIFERKFMQSCYFGKFVSGWSDDWVFEQDDEGIITRVGKGGRDVYNMVGVAYFKKNDTYVLIDAIRKASCDSENANLFWDDVVDRNIEQFSLAVNEVMPNQIAELDTIEELVSFDKSYMKYLE